MPVRSYATTGTVTRNSLISSVCQMPLVVLTLCSVRRSLSSHGVLNTGKVVQRFRRPQGHCGTSSVQSSEGHCRSAPPNLLSCKTEIFSTNSSDVLVMRQLSIIIPHQKTSRSFSSLRCHLTSAKGHQVQPRPSAKCCCCDL